MAWFKHLVCRSCCAIQAGFLTAPPPLPARVLSEVCCMHFLVDPSLKSIVALDVDDRPNTLGRTRNGIEPFERAIAKTKSFFYGFIFLYGV